MVGVRRPARQVMAPPAAAAASMSRYTLEALRVPGGAASGAQQNRTLAHVGGPNVLGGAGARLNLNAARHYLFRLTMPRDSTADRLSNTQVIIASGPNVANLATRVLLTLGNSASDTIDRIWAAGAADFAGAVNVLIFRTALRIASRANTPSRNYDSRYTLSACPLTVLAWGAA